MDVFRDQDELVAWIKTPTSNEFVKLDFQPYIYAQPHSLIIQALKKRDLPLTYTIKKTYDQQQKRVLKIPAPTKHFEGFVAGLEKDVMHQVPLYNADISPEQQCLYQNNLYAGKPLNHNQPLPPLKVATIHKQDNQLYYNDTPITDLQKTLDEHDPDVICAHKAFQLIPELATNTNFHRYKNQPLTYKGGKSYHSYGQIRYKDFGVRLQARFLLDTSTSMGSLHPDALLELCALSSSRYQQLASKSAGSVFQSALVRELLQEDVLVMHKQKPTPQPVRMGELVSQDRAGLSLDARVGIHTDVVEIDFTSMFPWLMHTKNISAETLSTTGKKVPGVDLHIRTDIDGYVARCLQPFLTKRLFYKANPSTINRKKAAALKAVLVSANGYLRYREFKLGLSTTHVALCAYVRKYFLQAKQLAEQQGFDVLHGVVDSLYIQKTDLQERDVQRLIWDIEKMTGIPMEFEGRFKWIVFLSSVTDNRPVPTRYYGALTTGDVKIRGVQARQQSQSRIIRHTQQRIIEYLARYNIDEFRHKIPQAIHIAKNALKQLPNCSAQDLAYSVYISKHEYASNCPQAQALKRCMHKPHPGEKIRYVYDAHGIRLLHEFTLADTDHYTDAMIRALHAIFHPFGYTKDALKQHLCGQQTLTQYFQQELSVILQH